MKKNYHLKKVVAFLFVLNFFLPVASFASHTQRDDGNFDAWRRSSSDLRNKIDDLDDDAVEDLPIPILFGIAVRNLSNNFGDPRSGGRIHEGLDIMAPKGAPIVSPTEAVVIRVGDGASSGYYVYTANPGDETFAYMHLDEMSDLDEGDVLETGDLIGYVGNTGNASGGSTHLHFEIKTEDGPTDPFPRLTETFDLDDKIDYLDKILNDHDDEEQFAEDMARLYRSELVLARTEGIELPDEIEDQLGAGTTAAVNTNTYTAPVGLDLTLGARGPAVVTLQKFLISKGVGSAVTITADGSFGPKTQKALAEYQASVGITPAAGYYGPKTRAYIASRP